MAGHWSVTAAAVAAVAVSAVGCVPEGARMFPNGGGGGGGGTTDAGPVPEDVSLLTLTMTNVDNSEICQITVTVVTAAGPFMFSEPAMPSCPVDFPVTREISFTLEQLGGMESMATVTAIARDGDGAVSAQASAAVILRLGFATDLALGLEAF